MLDTRRQDFTILNMQQAILRRNEFDCFIIDEADECITYRGVLYDEERQMVCGFWDMMKKPCFLFTASVGTYMEDILLKLFNVKADQFLSYRAILSNAESGACLIRANYFVGKTEPRYWQIIEDRIKVVRFNKPIIAFVNEKAKVKELKKIADRCGIAFYDAMTDSKALQARNYLKAVSKGLIVIDRQFGRGLDIRCKVDSHVLITFEPRDQIEAQQMAGRSSRTMKTHECSVVVQNNSIDAEVIRERVAAAGGGNEKDGIEVVKIMMGRRIAGVDTDQEIRQLFKKTWMIFENSLVRTLSKKKVTEYKDHFEKWLNEKARKD